MSDEYIESANEALDAVDEEIRDLIAERFNLVAALDAYKTLLKLPIEDSERDEEIVDNYFQDFGQQGALIAQAIIGKEL